LISEGHGQGLCETIPKNSGTQSALKRSAKVSVAGKRWFRWMKNPMARIGGV
jgi:hypothetical protein